MFLKLTSCRIKAISLFNLHYMEITNCMENRIIIEKVSVKQQVKKEPEFYTI
jgi:hypothetical protein